MISIERMNELWEVVKKGATLDAQEKVIELREEMVELRTINLELREAVQSLQQRLGLRELAFDGVVYWSELPGTEKPRDPASGPFCPSCVDSDSKRMRLQDHWNKGYTIEGWFCPACDRVFS